MKKGGEWENARMSTLTPFFGVAACLDGASGSCFKTEGQGTLNPLDICERAV